MRSDYYVPVADFSVFKINHDYHVCPQRLDRKKKLRRDPKICIGLFILLNII